MINWKITTFGKKNHINIYNLTYVRLFNSETVQFLNKGQIEIEKIKIVLGDS